MTACFLLASTYILPLERIQNSLDGGALVSTGTYEALTAGRGAAGLVKSGKKVIGNDYEYALAA